MTVPRPLATLLLAVATFVSPSGDADAQTMARTAPGEWWIHSGFGFAHVGGGFGDVLQSGSYFDLSVAKGAGVWRLGGGLQFEGLSMRRPYASELEWARLELFGSAMRVFYPEGGVRPYLEARPGLVRVHPRSLLFQNISDTVFAEGHNPTPSTNGIGLTVRPGVEIDIGESFALDLSGSFSTYSTEDYDLSPIRRPPVSEGSEWGIRAGFTWRPLGRGVPIAPGSADALPLSAQRSQRDAWGVPRSWGWAFTEMLGINFGASFLNEYTRGESSYPVTPQSWLSNLDRGWKFDDNKFVTNQIIHPFNGGTYFNSARSNGIDFWGSSLMAIFGAWLWECCGETQPMSWNDMLSTSLGGISEGEFAYRASSMILDNTATGWGRGLREVGAFVVNPVRGLNRLVSGRARSVRDNPDDPFDRHPPRILTWVNFGARTIGLGKSITDNTSRYGFLDLVLIYGDPFENTRRKPFDRFDAYLQLNAGDKTGLGRLQVRGDLWSTPIGDDSGPGTRHTFAIAHDFDYINNEAYEFGGQGLGVALFSRFGAFERRFITRLTVTGVVGAAVNADYSYLADVPNARDERDYDYGTGLGIAFDGLLTESARTSARLEYRYTLMGVFNGSLTDPAVGLFDFGSDARHQVHRAGLEVLVAISDRLSVGFQSTLFFRDSKYDSPELIDRTQRNPELKVYLTRSWR